MTDQDQEEQAALEAMERDYHASLDRCPTCGTFIHENPTVDESATYAGVPVRITHRAGDVRFGVLLSSAYGEVPGTTAPDGQPLDVYLGPDPEEAQAFVIRQRELDGQLELKLMLGFSSAGQAVRAYLDAMPDSFFEGVEAIPEGGLEDFLAPMRD